MKRSFCITAVLTHAELSQLTAAADDAMCPRPELVGQIVRAWLRNPPKGWQGELAASVDAQHRKGALERERLLKAWVEAVKRAKRRRWSVTDATEEFVRQHRRLYGRKLSRTTLYDWRTRYRGRGLEGLVDRRGGDRRTTRKGARGRL